MIRWCRALQRWFQQHGQRGLLGLGAPLSATADVATSETTTSATYTDLATSGPAVTLTPGRSTDQFLTIASNVSNATTGNSSFMSVAIAGAAAVDADALIRAGQTAFGIRAGAPILALAVANGSTHTAKYKSPSGTTATFSDRRILAFTLS